MANIYYRNEELSSIEVHLDNASDLQSYFYNPSTGNAAYWYIHWRLDANDSNHEKGSKGGFLNNSTEYIDENSGIRITNFTRGTTHTIYAHCTDDYSHSYTISRQFSLNNTSDYDALNIPTLTITNITTSSATLQLSNISTKANYSDRYPYNTIVYWKYKKSTEPNFTVLQQNFDGYSSSSLSKTVSGLDSGTLYNFQVGFEARYDSSQTLGLSQNATTDSASSPPSITLSSSNVTPYSVTLTVSATSLRKTCYCYVYKNGVRDTDYGAITLTSSSLSGSQTINNLTPNTTYSFYYTAQYSNESDWSQSGTVTPTTSAITGTLIFGDASPSSITIKVKNAYSGYWKWYKRVYTSNNSNSWTYIDATSVSSNGSTISKEFTGLSFNGTFYDIKASHFRTSSSTTADYEITKTRLNCFPTGEENGENDPVSYFSYNTWNFMVESVATLIGGSSNWNNTYATFSNTKMTNTTAGRTLTANRMNSLWYNIRKNGGSIAECPIFEAGDTVYAYSFRFQLGPGIDSML